MKLRKLFLGIIAVLSTLIFTSSPIYAATNYRDSTSDATLAEQTISVDEYLLNVKHFKKINAKKADHLFTKKDGKDRYLYIGRPTCYYCRQYSPVLKDFSKLIKHKLYYLDVSASSKNDSYAFDVLQIPGTPTVMRINNGDVANAWVGGGKSASELYSFLKNNQ